MNKHFAWLLLAAALFACTSPRTQVMVLVTADPDVEADVRRMRVIVQGGSSDGTFEAPAETGLVPQRWPVRVPIVPSGGDASRVFRVEVVALGAGDGELLTARAASSFVAGETRALVLHLRSVCRGVRCEQGLTCGGGGDCVSAIVNPTTLPVYDPDQHPDGGPPLTPDGGPADGGSADGGQDAGDGGAPAACGNGVQEGAEACDDGPNNGMYGACNATCTGPGPRCGDGEHQPAHEGCDDGAATATCTETCVVREPVCGDGWFVPGELCYEEGTTLAAAAGLEVLHIVAGNFDGDGAPDVMAAGEGWVAGLRGDGAGGFAIVSMRLDGLSVQGLAVARLPTRDEGLILGGGCGATCAQFVDPLTDLIVRAQYNAPTTARAVGTSSATSTVALIGATTASAHDVGLLDGEGPASFVRVNTSGSESAYIRSAAISVDSVSGAAAVWTVRGSGRVTRYPISGDMIDPSATSIGFVETDATIRPHVTVASPRGNQEVFVTATGLGGTMRVTAFDPVTAGSLYSVPGGVGRLVRPFFEDVDGDGQTDIVLVTTTGIVLMRQDGGAFAVPVTLWPSTCTISDAAVADFNRDGALDFALVGSCGGELVLASP